MELLGRVSPHGLNLCKTTEETVKMPCCRVVSRIEAMIMWKSIRVKCWEGKD